MKHVNVTEFRQHLPAYLASVQQGNAICITSHGHIIAHIIPPVDLRITATKKLANLRKNALIGDVISPINDKWDAAE